jgi:hypothetical protein
LVGTVKGGVSSILRALLNTFLKPHIHDLRRSGVCLLLKTGNSLHLWILSCSVAILAQGLCKEPL